MDRNVTMPSTDRSRRFEEACLMLFSKLISWWRRRPLKQLSIIMYTRQGCHLCESAWQELQQYQRRSGFNLETVDIAADPALVQEYGDLVPVVAVNGKVRFRGVINRVLLERLLRAEALKASQVPRPGPPRALESS